MKLSLSQAHAELLRGQVVAVGTDTVYGLAATLNNSEAISAIYELKGRPEGMALPILINSLEQAAELGLGLDERAENLSLLWPGALTMVVPAPAALSSKVHGENSVGIRIPDHQHLLELLALTGPLAVTSANPHGEPPATTAEMAERYFANHDSFAGVYSEEVGSGSASTIVDLTGEGWTILREGGISPAVLEALLFKE